MGWSVAGSSAAGSRDGVERRDGRPCAPRAGARRGREGGRSAASALAGSSIQASPRARSRRAQGVAAHLQQGPQQEHAAPLRPGGRRRPGPQPPEGRRVRTAHQLALNHVVRGVGQQHDACARRPCSLGQQGVARRAGGGGQAGRRLGAAPLQPAPLRSRAGGGGGGQGAPARGVGREAVVHGQGQQRAARTGAPCRRQAQQRQAVASARKAQGHRRGGRGVQPPVELVKDAPLQGGGVERRQPAPHWARERIAVARTFTAAGAEPA